MYVSRRHAILKWDGQCFFVEDLASKHGTEVNGREIQARRPLKIAHGDQLSLAKGAVTITFQVVGYVDDRTRTLTNILAKHWDPLVIDLGRKEVRLEGELLNLAGKERELLFLLYANKDRAVSYEEIKLGLWPERRIRDDMVPEVGSDEINALVYRLRKRLGNYGHKVVTVARFGILFDL